MAFWESKTHQTTFNIERYLDTHNIYANTTIEDLAIDALIIMQNDNEKFLQNYNIERLLQNTEKYSEDLSLILKALETYNIKLTNFPKECIFKNEKMLKLFLILKSKTNQNFNEKDFNEMNIDVKYVSDKKLQTLLDTDNAIIEYLIERKLIDTIVRHDVLAFQQIVKNFEEYIGHRKIEDKNDVFALYDKLHDKQFLSVLNMFNHKSE